MRTNWTVCPCRSASRKSVGLVARCSRPAGHSSPGRAVAGAARFMTSRSVWQKFSLSWLPVMARMVPPASRNGSKVACKWSMDSRRLSGRLSSLNRSPAMRSTSTCSWVQYPATRSTARRRSSVRSMRPRRSPRCQSAVWRILIASIIRSAGREVEGSTGKRRRAGSRRVENAIQHFHRDTCPKSIQIRVGKPSTQPVINMSLGEKRHRGSPCAECPFRAGTGERMKGIWAAADSQPARCPWPASSQVTAGVAAVAGALAQVEGQPARSEGMVQTRVTPRAQR